MGGSRLNFGNPNPNSTIVNPAILEGWGVRPYDWQFGASVQQQLMPRLSVEVSYNRRWFGNFFVTDNQPHDARPITTSGQRDPAGSDCCRMPGAPQPTINITQPRQIPAELQNYQTFETDFAPARTQYWHGVNVSLNARLRNGLTVQGGTGTGRGVHNTCGLYCGAARAFAPTLQGAWRPMAPPTSGSNRAMSPEPWLTSFRGWPRTTIPKIDVLISANMRSVPGANLGMGSTSATNGTSLRRELQCAKPRRPADTWTACRRTGWRTEPQQSNLNLPAQVRRARHPGWTCASRKSSGSGRMRADVGIDLHNVFNTSRPDRVLADGRLRDQRWRDFRRDFG